MSKLLQAITRVVLATLCVLGLATPAHAWGPHAAINRAARERLPADSPLRTFLGETHFADLDRLCVLADWRREPRADFFPDDYLLFPASPVDRDHLVPEVRKTYEPFFRRALWALRHEAPENAARWVGSLLHYVSDTSSPAHAAEVRGALHSPMEGWLDAKAIRIPNYAPRLLGETDDAAARGVVARMEEVIAYCRVRGEQLKQTLDLRAGRRDLSESLECALEGSRVTADVLHTLGERLRAREPGGTLRGQVVLAGGSPEYLPRLGARVVIPGTAWSTVTGPDGRFSFRDLPPGRYRLGALRPGVASVVSSPYPVALGQETEATLRLEATSPAANRLRNPDFSLRWVRDDAPDAWLPLTTGYPEKPAAQSGWASENVAVAPGHRYRVGADLLAGKGGRVAVRFRGHAMAWQNVTVVELSDPKGEVFTVPEAARYLQVLLLTDGPPGRAFRQAWCVAEPDAVGLPQPDPSGSLRGPSPRPAGR